MSQLAFRMLKGIVILNAAPHYEPPEGFNRPEGNFRCCGYSNDGSCFAWASPDSVTVINPSTGSFISEIPAPNVFEVWFSPLGTYTITWQRPAKGHDGHAIKNLKIWKTFDGQTGESQNVFGEFVQRSQNGCQLQYTADETLCALPVSNEIVFYKSDDMSTVSDRLILEGVTDFALSPGKQKNVAVFVPGRKGHPSSVKVYNVSDFSKSVSSRSFVKGDKVQFKWNEAGSSLIVLAQTDVDKSNMSYYGESNLFLLSSDPSGVNAIIKLDKEGPIHDVAWSPNSKEFGVVYGYMPAKTTIFNIKADAVHSLSLGPRNTISFSPSGRFVLVAGFGNLAGQMDIYDIQKDYKKVSTFQASNATICEWSPDGRFIVTAITSPRLRVDNGVRIWHINGELMYHQDLDELYDVKWRPQKVEESSMPDPFDPVPKAHASAVAYLSSVKKPSGPAGAYRPPGARGSSTPLHFKREDEGGSGLANANGNSYKTDKYRRYAADADGHPGGPLPPGVVPVGGLNFGGSGEGGEEGLSKAALKNKKKRDAKRAKDGMVPMNSKPRGRDELMPYGSGSGGGNLRVPSRARSGRRTSRNREPGRAMGPGEYGGKPRSGNATYARNGAYSDAYEAGLADEAPRTTGPVASSDAGNDDPDNGTHGASSTKPPDMMHDRKVRSLLKKMRAIEELKSRQACGEKLEHTQIMKISSEDWVRAELVGLGVEV